MKSNYLTSIFSKTSTSIFIFFFKDFYAVLRIRIRKDPKLTFQDPDPK
jgi:hypothetical protein